MQNNLYYQDEYLKEKFNFRMLWRLMKSVGKHKTLLIGSIFVELFTSMFSLLPSVLFSVIVGAVFPSDGVFAENWPLVTGLCLGGIAAVWAGLVVGYYLESLIPGKFGHVVCAELRTEIFNRLTVLPFRYYDTHSTGKILVRVTNYIDELSEMFSNLFYVLLYFLGVTVVGTAWALALDWRVGGAVLLGFLPLAVLMWFLSKSLHTRAGTDHNKNSNYTAFVAENIGGAEVVQAYNRGKINGEAAAELFDDYGKAFMRSTRVREAFFPLAHGFSKAVCTLITYGVALALILTGWGGGITLAAVIAIASVIGEMTNGVSTLCEFMSDISTLTTNVERIYDTIDTSVEICNRQGAVPLNDCVGSVKFDRVNFSYVEGIPVLKNFTLEAAAGQTVALVGSTGSGKTTIVNLLSRFYEAQEGSVLIDGKDVRAYTLESLRSRVGSMMQDTYIFSGSVLDNIRFARPDATDAECIAAAESACADGFIRRLPEGYETQISEGYALSGGERQQLSFARLILANPKIIVLDEATSHIDTQTELELQQSLKTLLAGRTSFVIAHRLSTVRNADKIVFIKDGEIAEQGTHEELLKKGGYYADMLKSAAI